ncbi:CHASE2 domain-containing protein [Curvibacter sp. CHRR-16]|uniref:CHASE2 domain-containing serine/threonine-protein kinase n=1 Tax=Curvibacter sp. CHRR-16 TaxID=2835872 RepID=UPI0032EA6EBF
MWLFTKWATPWWDSMERRLYDAVTTAQSTQASERIAIIAIDEASIVSLGRWPWARDVHARLIDMLAAAHAKTVVLSMPLLEPQVDPGLNAILKMRFVLDTMPSGANSPLAPLVDEAMQALDGDAKLAASIQQAGNVLLAQTFEWGPAGAQVEVAPSSFAAKSAVAGNVAGVQSARRGVWPMEAFANHAAFIGHSALAADPDGVLRREQLLVQYGGRLYPSLALATAAHSLSLSAAQIRWQDNDGIRLGRIHLRTNRDASLWMQFYKSSSQHPAFAVDSFVDVLTGKIPASKYKDKVVLIGVTTGQASQQFSIPGALAYPVEGLAQAVADILSESYYVQMPYGNILSIALFGLLVGGLLLMALWESRYTYIFCIALTITLVGAEVILLTQARMWLELLWPACFMAVGGSLLWAWQVQQQRRPSLQAGQDANEALRSMGLSLQTQGQLDLAFDQFKRVHPTAVLLDNLYALASDFERKRQFNKAADVYRHLLDMDSTYKDARIKLQRVQQIADNVVLGAANTGKNGVLLQSDSAIEKPTLGRYTVERELGKGSMGVVYVGHDIKIGRAVAIKTMALSQEFAQEDLAEARKRFFREAEMAGCLQHQNIVTIFDAGEEHDLAYIAMELLEGHDLTPHCKPANLLTVETVLSIVSRVADALDYAHDRRVLHRDIKPANVMYDAKTDMVKVTDFGIARITDATKTRTALVLGTPSYMSPEQLAGRNMDGRSDQYSLAVMLFQLLTGVLPFRADTMTELMYKISNAQAPDLRSLREELPRELAQLVQKAMDKNPHKRFARCSDMAKQLRLILAAMQARQSDKHDEDMHGSSFQETVFQPEWGETGRQAL